MYINLIHNTRSGPDIQLNEQTGWASLSRYLMVIEKRCGSLNSKDESQNDLGKGRVWFKYEVKQNSCLCDALFYTVKDHSKSPEMQFTALFISFFSHVWLFLLHIYLCITSMHSAHRSQKMALDILEK